VVERHKGELLASASDMPQPPHPSPSATLVQSWSGCQVTATYVWSGFKGADGSVAAEIRIYMNGNLEGSSGTTIVSNPSGGSQATTFGTDPSPSNNDFVVDARLVRLNNGRTVRGSLRTSSVQSQPCFAD
jgi:hypothetical protein